MVPYRSEAFIAEIAAICRIIGTKPKSHYVNLKVILDELQAHGVESIVQLRGVKRKGRLTIELEKDDETKPEAHVQFVPRLTLRVQESIWKRFLEGQSKEYEIIAHEVGHILLHDDTAKPLPFSFDGTKQIKFAEQEYSAEWQAHRFSDHLLVPSQLARNLNDVDRIAVICNVTEIFAAERLAAVKATEKPITSICLEPCVKCGSNTLLMDAAGRRCDWCGHTEQTHFG